MTHDIYTGTIKTFKADRGFGFIRRTTEPDLFFHVRHVMYLKDTIREGQEVSFQIGNGRDDKPMAIAVTLVADSPVEPDFRQHFADR
jgi:cold shock CspA family protein